MSGASLLATVRGICPTYQQAQVCTNVNVSCAYLSASDILDLNSVPVGQAEY